MNRFVTFGIAAVLVLLIPTAVHADTYLYSVRGFDAYASSFSFYETNLTSTGSVTGADLLSVTGIPSGFGSFVFSWDTGNSVSSGMFSNCPLAPGQGSVGGAPGYGCAAYGFTNPTLGGVYSIWGDAFPLGSFLTTGTFVGVDNLASVTSTHVSPVPEPSSVMLLVTGAVVLFGLKKLLRH